MIRCNRRVCGVGGHRNTPAFGGKYTFDADHCDKKEGPVNGVQEATPSEPEA
jgi:hypothetical protein